MLNLDAAYREHARMVYCFLKSLCYDNETAEELTQETFYQAVRCADKYDGTCKVSTWLCQIAKHLWYQEQERKKKKGTKILDDSLVSDKKLPDEEMCIREEKMELFRKVHIFGELFGKNENWARVTFYRAKQKIVKG